jgi:predicted nucleic acid-binding protein
MSILFDTSIYVAALRDATGERVVGSPVLQRWGSESTPWLSSVVLEELYEGADPPTLSLIQKMNRGFDRIRRVLTPSARDWARAGKILRQIGRRQWFEETGRGRLTNDAMIATSAARQGMTVITANLRDFERLAEYCTVRWQTTV